jgi:hypothetical protein
MREEVREEISRTYPWRARMRCAKGKLGRAHKFFYISFLIFCTVINFFSYENLFYYCTVIYFAILFSLCIFVFSYIFSFLACIFFSFHICEHKSGMTMA